MTEGPRLARRTRGGGDDRQTALERDLQDARRRRAELRAELDEVEGLIARLEELRAQVMSSELDGQGWSGGAGWVEPQRCSRTEAIIRVLARSAEPLTLSEIVSALHAVGRDDPMKHVAATLTYLKRQHRVRHLDSRRWEAARAALS